MGTATTRTDRFIARVKHHPAAAVLIAAGTLVIGLAAFTDAARSLLGLFLGTTPEEARLEMSKLSLPFSEAAFVGRADAQDERAVALFLAAGMRPDATDAEGATALMRAAGRGNTALVDALLKAGANVNLADRSGDTALGWAAAAGKAQVLDRLVQHRPDAKALGGALVAGAGAGSIAGLDLLGRAGADVKSYGGAALLAAAESALDEEEQSSLVAKWLVERGARLEERDEHGWTPLTLAIDHRSLTMTRILIAGGAGVETMKKNGWRPLHVAAASQVAIPEIVDVLLAAGADVQARCSCDGFLGGGWTPLLLAAYRGNTAIVGRLLDRGADIQAANGDGRTALWFAADDDYPEIARLLVTKGARVDEPDHLGITPLMAAASGDHVDIAKLLLAAGARVALTDRRGRTAYDYATRSGSEGVAKTLRHTKTE